MLSTATAAQENKPSRRDLVFYRLNNVGATKMEIFIETGQKKTLILHLLVTKPPALSNIHY